MAERRYTLGETVLVSRDESGENHEEATVVDVYELLMGEEKRPMIVVDFADGERKWVAALEPNVLPVEPGEAEETPGEEGAGGEAAAGEAAGEGES